MKLKKRYRVLICVLAACVLLGTGAFVFYHGEWWYPLLSSLRPVPQFSPEAVIPECEEPLSPDAVFARDNINYSSVLMLINAEYPLPEGFTPDVVEYNGAKMHPLMKEPYIAMRDSVQAKTGTRIYVSSDFRTSEEQASILEEKGDSIAAAVGSSEHEAGISLDVYAPYYAGMNFLRSRAGREINDSCSDYGFIIRYPHNKEAITGIAYEPWHLRYVGAPHAKLIMQHGLTLEEYLTALVPDTWYQSDGYYIARLSPDNLALPKGYISCDISPDNMGYFVITAKMQ